MTNYSNSIQGVIHYITERLAPKYAEQNITLIEPLNDEVLTNVDALAVITPTSSDEVVSSNHTFRESADMLISVSSFEDFNPDVLIDRLQALLFDELSLLHYTEISENSAVIIDAEQGAAELGSDTNVFQVRIPLTFICQY